MIVFKALGALLAYPSQAMLEALPEIRAVIEQTKALKERERRALGELMDELAAGDPIDLEERYVALFDRGRATSLHLFEHVHGESRERGAAMVDLRQIYQRAGLRLAGNELPDYLPAVLEFVSLRPREEGEAILLDCAHLLRGIGEALRARQSRYGAVFSALLALIGEAGLTRAQPAQPTSTEEALDDEWAEEPVIFGPSAECGTTQPQVAKIQVVSRKQAATRQPNSD